MGNRIDLTGQTFGKLTVLGFGDPVPNGRRTTMTSYRCQCACGSPPFDVPVNRMGHRPKARPADTIDACLACRGRPCLACGARVPLTGGLGAGRATCSPRCEREHARGRHTREVLKDPAFDGKRHRKLVKRMATDPEYAARAIAQRRERQREYRKRQALRAQADPAFAAEYRGKRNERSRRSRQIACYAEQADRSKARQILQQTNAEFTVLATKLMELYREPERHSSCPDRR